MINFISKITQLIKRTSYKYCAPLLASGYIRDYLAHPGPKHLNLGCGSNILPNWLNCDGSPCPDAVFMDCTKNFPLPSGSFDHVFAEHLIEHMELPAIEAFLQECHRILKPGGTIRLVTPNLDTFIQMMMAPQSGQTQKYIEWHKNRCAYAFPASPVRAINSIFQEHGHKFIMNESFMTELLIRAGFFDARSYAVGKSRLTALCGIDKHGSIIGEEINQIESLVMEATKR